MADGTVIAGLGPALDQAHEFGDGGRVIGDLNALLDAARRPVAGEVELRVGQSDALE
jgi:hypothetical protein